MKKKEKRNFDEAWASLKVEEQSEILYNHVNLSGQNFHQSPAGEAIKQSGLKKLAAAGIDTDRLVEYMEGETK